MKLMMKVLSHTKAFSEKDIKDLLFSLDKLLLKIPKNSWENTCVGISFLIKWKAAACPMSHLHNKSWNYTVLFVRRTTCQTT